MMPFIDLSLFGPETLAEIRPDLEAELERLADWWADHGVDYARGGFHGEIGPGPARVPGAPKRVVPLARIGWFYAMLAMRTGDHRHAVLADRARDYLLKHFLDREHGGVFWEVTPLGDPADTRKQGYAQAFALYCLAAHYRLTESGESLSQALALFGYLETLFRDSEHDGYWEAFARDGGPLADVRLSDKDDPAPKSMNTHLHIMEAYAELARAVPEDERVRAALANLVELHIGPIYNAGLGCLRLFWEGDWTDRTRFISFGHDIEASWLIWDAAQLTRDVDLMERARPVVLHLAEAVLQKARGVHGEIWNEQAIADGHVDVTRIWWVQAEGLVGHLNAMELGAGDAHGKRAREIWHFIEAHVIDRHGGEWRWHSDLDDAIDPYWGGAWKACYHNGRAMMEALDRIDRITAAR